MIGRLGDIRLSRIVISSEARNLYHSRRGAHTFPTCTAHFSAFLICFSYRLCPIRPFGAPSPQGRLTIRRKPTIKRPSGIASYILAAKPPSSFLVQERLSSLIKGQHTPQANLKPKEPQKCGAFLWLFHSLSSTRALLRVYPWSFLFRKVPSFQTCPDPGSHRSKRYGSVRKQLCP